MPHTHLTRSLPRHARKHSNTLLVRVCTIGPYRGSTNCTRHAEGSRRGIMDGNYVRSLHDSIIHATTDNRLDRVNAAPYGITRHSTRIR